MTEITPRTIIVYIEQNCENQPPDEAGDVTTLWQDFDEDSLDEEIADLWRWGIVEVEWCEDEQEQYIHLTDFGEELHEKGVAETYMNAKLGIVPEPVDVGLDVTRAL